LLGEKTTKCGLCVFFGRFVIFKRSSWASRSSQVCKFLVETLAEMDWQFYDGGGGGGWGQDLVHCVHVELLCCVCVRWRCSRATAPEFSLVNICRNRRTRHSLVCVYACNKQPANSTQITAGRVELVQLLNVDKNEKGRKESKKAMAMV
jgi:hypothetical protein